jgi:phage baseplate assembly protein W
MSVTGTGPIFPDFPYHLDGRGHTATTSAEDHIHDLIEQVLFTSPGERVNRPTFGTGLLQYVFLPNSEPLATATRAAVQGALVQWLSDLIEVRDVEVSADDATLRVTVQYSVRGRQPVTSATFVRGTP